MRLATLLLISAFLVAGCGEEASLPMDASPVGPLPGDRTKPRPDLGELSLEIVDRPAFGEVRVRAMHVPADTENGCVLELVLPDGAFLVRGEETRPIPAGESTSEWHINFAQGAGHDLTARLCAETPRGVRRQERYLRLDP